MDFCKAYNAADREPARHDRPRRDHRLRGPLVHVRPEDAADPVLLRQAAGLEKGSQTPGRDDGRHGHRRAGRRDRADQDARPQRQRPRRGQEAGRGHRPLDGHQGRLAVRHRSPRTTSPRARPPRGRHAWRARQEVHRRSAQVRPRPAAHADRGARAGEEPGDGQVRRDRRAGGAPRRRPPQGRPDGARHRRPARRAPARTCASPCSPPGDAAAEARAAGADIVGADDLVAAGRGRDARLRRRDRHARPHAPGRPARPHASVRAA